MSSSTSLVGKSQGVNRNRKNRGSLQEPRQLETNKGGVLYHGTNKRFYRYHDEKYAVHEGNGHGHGHGHAAKPHSILTAMASAVINYLLMFGLCCAYGMIMFTDEWNAKHRGLGVKLNLGTVMIMGGLLSWQSKVPVAMGGPDLNPVVFLGTFVGTMSEEIAKQLSLEYPGAGRRLEEEEECTGFNCVAWFVASNLRFLGSSSSEKDEDVFCTGSHYEAYKADCDDYHDQLRATTIFATTVSTLLLATLYFLLGNFKKTRYVNYVPTNIMEAFLACVGFKVFKYALKFCKYDAKQFMPAAMIGVPLYFMKAKHIGNPAVVLPSMLLIPLGFFYIALFASGSDLKEARKNKIMFPEIEDVNFWCLWTDSIGKASKINFKAWLATMVDLVIMLIVCCMDNLLKLSSTEVKLPVKVDKDYEIQLHGKGNILTALCGCSVGYMQLKFNVINYGVMGNATDRRGGALCALLCGICFFTTIEHFNFLPRVFLSTLLFFAGSGFVAENLWGSRLYLGFDEWMQVVMVLAVFIALNSLLYAVIAGGLMIGVSFVVRYSKVPCTVGPPLYGGELLSCERRFAPLQATIRHIARQWLLVVRLKGFVFFASATNLVRYLREEVAFHCDEEEEYKRLRFIIMDCEALDAMDSSAAKAFMKFAKDAKSADIRVLWSGVDKAHEKSMRRTKLLSEDEQVFADLDEGVLYVEDRITEYRAQMQQRWKEMSFAFGIGQHLLCEHMQYEPFDEVLDSMDAQFGGRWDYCRPITVKAYQEVLWNPGEEGRELYLVHSGAVALFDELRERAQDDKHHHDGNIMPVAVYRHGWFLNREALMRVPTRFFAVPIEDGQLLAWTRNQWMRMEREQPWMASRIMEEAMSQAQADVERTVEDLLHAHEAEDHQEEFTHHFSELVGHHHHAHHDDHRRKSMSERHGSLFSDSGGSQSKKDRLSKKLLKSATGMLTVQNPTASMQLLQNKMQLEFDEPQGLFPMLESANAALFLEHHGLYEAPGEPGILPPLPPHIQNSLRQAFETYQVDSPNGKVVPWDLATDALNMAGVFGFLLANTTRGPLNMVEFLELGHEAALARFSQWQIDKIYVLYNELDDNKDGVLSIEEAIRLIAKLFTKKRPTYEDVRSLSEPWVSNGNLDKEAFVVMISRYVKKFGITWLLLDAMRELFNIPRWWRDGKQVAANVTGDKLFTPEVLEKINMTENEFAEILWATGCTGEESPQEIDFIDLQTLVQAARMYVGKVNADLPPCWPARSLKEVSQDSKRAAKVAAKWLSNFSTSVGDSNTGNGGAGGKIISSSKTGKKIGRRVRSNSTRRNTKDESPDKRSFGSAFGTLDVGKAETDATAGNTKLASDPELSPAKSDREDSSNSNEGVSPAAVVTKLPEMPAEASKSAPNSRNRMLAEASESMKCVIDVRTLAKKAARAEKDTEAVKCPQGHALLQNTAAQLPQGKKVFTCGRCARKANASVQAVYCCNECNYYVCEPCGNRQVAAGVPLMSDGLVIRGISGVALDSNKPRLTELLPRPEFEDPHKKPDPLDRIREDDPFNGNCREKIYVLLFKPDLTLPGRVISNFMGAMIVLNLSVMIFKPFFCVPGDPCWKAKIWLYIEAIFAGLFTLEFLMRLAVCNAYTNKAKDFVAFLKNPSNLCDLFSVLPFYFSLASDSGGAGSWALILKVVRLFRLARIMRAMRLATLLPKRFASIVPPVMMIFLVIWGIYNKEVEFATKKK